jgi:hypothetical protein
VIVDAEPFVILVADQDATVGVISSMLLSSALTTEIAAVNAVVRTLVEPESNAGIKQPELPNEIRKIEEAAISATRAEIESARLIVAFSGINTQKLNELRERGVTAPAVNLCQFVGNLEGVAHHSLSPELDLREVIVGAAMQFGFSGGSSVCSICEAKDGANIDYWINIADTCTRFAHTVQRLQS